MRQLRFTVLEDLVSILDRVGGRHVAAPRHGFPSSSLEQLFAGKQLVARPAQAAAADVPAPLFWASPSPAACAARTALPRLGIIVVVRVVVAVDEVVPVVGDFGLLRERGFGDQHHEQQRQCQSEQSHRSLANKTRKR